MNYNKLGEILFFGGLTGLMITLLFLIPILLFDLQFDSIIHSLLSISGISFCVCFLIGIFLYLEPITNADYKRNLENSQKMKTNA